MNTPQQPAAGQAMTFEQIDAHIGDFDFKSYMPAAVPQAGAAVGNAAMAPAALGLDLGKFCPVYGKVKPILSAVLAFPLIPKKWKDGIQALMSLLDTVCP